MVNETEIKLAIGTLTQVFFLFSSYLKKSKRIAINYKIKLEE